MPAAAAAATPLLVQPIMATMSPGLVVVAGLLTVAAMIPLALGLADKIEDEHDRRLVIIATALLSVVGGVSVDVRRHRTAPSGRMSRSCAGLSIGAIPLVPGSGRRRTDEPQRPPRRGDHEPPAHAIDRTRPGRRDAALRPRDGPAAVHLADRVLARGDRRRRPVHGSPARPARDACANCSATWSSRLPRRNAPGSPPTSTTRRSRS